MALCKYKKIYVYYTNILIIIVIKVMRVIIFDQMGNVLNKFGCSKHLEFPNGVVVNDKEEIFISDNRAHCVKVALFTLCFSTVKLPLLYAFCF